MASYNRLTAFDGKLLDDKKIRESLNYRDVEDIILENGGYDI